MGVIVTGRRWRGSRYGFVTEIPNDEQNDQDADGFDRFH
jgi:hypothetical protein